MIKSKLQRIVLSSLLAAALPLTSAAAAVVPSGTTVSSNLSAPFADASQINRSLLEAVQQAVSLGLMNGYSDGQFHPAESVSRQELAAILNRTLQLEQKNQAAVYSDVPASSWSSSAIGAVTQAGIMAGNGAGQFLPKAAITRQETAVMLIRAAGQALLPETADFKKPRDWNLVADWAKPYVRTALLKGYMELKGDTFSPKAYVQRQELAGVLITTFFSGHTMANLQSITSGRAIINGVKFGLSEQAATILSPDNQAVLSGAELSFSAGGRTIHDLKALHLTSSGKEPASGQPEFSGNLVLDGHNARLDGTLELHGDYLSVQNMAVGGDLVVTPKLLNDFKASHVTVNGKTRVLGGSSHTVVFEDSTLGTVNVNKNGVHVEVSGSTTADQVLISSDASISANAAAPLSNIVLSDGAGKVAINGTAANVTITGQNAVTLTGNAVIANLNVQSAGAVTLHTTGTVQNLQVSNNAAKVTVDHTNVQNVNLAPGVQSSAVSGLAAPSGNAAPAANPPVNTAPRVVAPVADRILTLGKDEVIDISGVFKDDEQSELKLTAASSNTATVRAVLNGAQLTLTPLKAGNNITILIAADDLNGKKTNSTFKVSVNTPPVKTSAVADQTLMLDNPPGEINLNNWFSDSDADTLTFEAHSSDPTVATAQISGSTLTLTGQKAGNSTITLSAKDGRGGTASAEFLVHIIKNPSSGTLKDQLLPVHGTPVNLPLDEVFTDDHPDKLSYRAVSSDSSVVTAEVYGSALTLTPLEHGRSVITVTANNEQGGSRSGSFKVNVNTVPVVSAIADISLSKEDHPLTLKLSDYFSDPDRDTLAFSAQSSDPSVALTEIQGDSLLVTPVGHGSTRVSIVANDQYDGLASTEFKITVNHPPMTGVSPLTDLTAQENGEAVTIDLSQAFSDPDHDELSYTVSPSDTNNVQAAITGHTLRVTPKVYGSALLTVTAKDSYGGTYQQSFNLKINAQPVASPIGDESLVEQGAAKEINLSSYISDPDGDMLAFTAQSDDPAKVLVAVHGDKLTLIPKATGTATITIAVADSRGGSSSVRFTATVRKNGAPVTGGLVKQMLQENGTPVTLDLSAHFTDPEKDPITYSAVSLNSGIAAVTLTDFMLKITPRAQGTTQVEITAADDKGNLTTTRLDITVNGSPIAVSGQFQDVLLQENESSLTLPLSAAFQDPENDSLTFTANVNGASIAETDITGDLLKITPKAHGTALITVTADDGKGGTGQASFNARVNAQPVVVSGKLLDTLLSLTSPAEEWHLDQAFQDADGDLLSYSALSGDSSIVTASVNGEVLKLTPVAKGSAEITVKASDAFGGSVTKTFKATVSEAPPNQNPEAVAAISTQILTPGVTNPRNFDLSQLFEDPDNDPLTYAAVIDNPAAGSVGVSGNTLTLAPAAGSSASGTVTVTASDGRGGKADYSFRLTTAQLVSGGLVPVRTKAGVQSLSYDLTKTMPGQSSFSVYMGTPDSTFTGPAVLTGTKWTGTPTSGYIWIVGADGRAVVLNISVSPQGSSDLYFSQYLDGGNGRMAVQLYSTDKEPTDSTKYTVEVYQYLKATKTIRPVSVDITNLNKNVPYIMINYTFYDFFDLTPAMYYNTELQMYDPANYDVVALVLKKNGQIIDVLGDPSSTQKFMPSGGTIIRKQGIYSGSQKFSLEGEWNEFPVGSYQFIGFHTP